MGTFPWIKVAALGGLGAILPLIVEFVGLDGAAVAGFLAAPDAAVVLGHGIRATGYFFIGALWTGLQYKDLVKPSHAVQLGIVAPMTVSAMLAGQASGPEAQGHQGYRFTGVAYAEDSSTPPTRFPKLEFGDRMFHSFSRKTPEVTWWVMSPEVTADQANGLMLKLAPPPVQGKKRSTPKDTPLIPNITPLVIGPHEDQVGYVVVLGHSMGRSAAEQLFAAVRKIPGFETFRLVSFPKVQP